MTSNQAVLANRRNARLSTGPKDTSRTRFNAIKHGILSDEILTINSDEQKDFEKFEALRGWLTDDLQPTGAMEEILADKLIAMTWRWLRVVRYETATIQKKLELATGYWEENNALDNLVLRTGGENQHQTSRELIAIVEDLRKDLAALRNKNPFAKRPQIWRLVFILAADPINVPISEVLGLERPYTEYSTFNETQARQVIAAACEKAKISEHEFWAAVRSVAKGLIERCNGTLEHHRPALERIRRLTSLPDDNELSKIARYEAHISRQFYKALHELERIQSARGGQLPPAPLAIDVSVESGPRED